LTLENWRRGIFFLILIAALQDPVRKMVPGAPGYLALSIMPVWFVMVARTFPLYGECWQRFNMHFLKLPRAVKFFFISLIPAALISATYGPGSWQITLVGILSYSSLLLGALTGYMQLSGRGQRLEHIFSVYCLITAVMLVGTPMEYLGVFDPWGAVGTRSMGTTWLQTSIYGMGLKMIAGFYRSPDVMGWHSVMMSMFAVLLALKNRGARRSFWLAVAGWGIVGGMLCGRRKMMYMLPVFVFVLVSFFWRIHSHRFQFRGVMIIVVSAGLAGYGVYNLVGPNAGVEIYYSNNIVQMSYERVHTHGVDSVIETVRQSGFWGEGLGTATQGIHHLRVAKPRTWQEGGLSKIMVELGVPGFIAALLMMAALIRSLFHVVHHRVSPESEDFILYAGLVAILCANGGSFVVSHQIFGDPFVILFFAFLCGLVLSGALQGRPIVQRVPVSQGLITSVKLGS